MKAIVFREYGSPDVLRYEEIPTPVPKDHEIRVKVFATSVNIGDLWARNFRAMTPAKFSMPLLFWLPARMYFGFRKPRIRVLGNEFAGEVEAVGQRVTRFRVGDPVFGYLAQSMGAYAEYLCISQDGLVAPKPVNMTYEEAAVIPYGCLTARSLLKKVNIQPGQHVLINGASGGIGSAAVQLAKSYGAEITGVCGTPRLSYVTALGADHVIDYTTSDFTQQGHTYDVIFDILGKSSWGQCKSSLKPQGRYLLASFKMKQVFQMMWTAMMGGKKVVCAMSSDTAQDLSAIRELAEAGQIKSIIDQCFPLEETAEAHRYMETGQAKGKVAITVSAR